MPRRGVYSLASCDGSPAAVRRLPWIVHHHAPDGSGDQTDDLPRSYLHVIPGHGVRSAHFLVGLAIHFTPVKQVRAWFDGCKQEVV
jgi:hypothetical protein